MGIGTVHHVAVKTDDQDEQRMWQQVYRTRGCERAEIETRLPAFDAPVVSTDAAIKVGSN